MRENEGADSFVGCHVVVFDTIMTGSPLFILINYPIVIINDIFIEVFFSGLEMQSYEPLVGEWVVVHFVSCLPLVEGSAQLDSSVSWSTILEHEGEWLLVESCSIEG